ncbi:MAG: hypothetical protein Q8N96_02715 [Methylovulum sp.]|nr:hypothetical protein [Methylovulum sp.]
MTIDTEIRHTTLPGADLFLELGFAPDEAARFHAESQQCINDALLVNKKASKFTLDALANMLGRIGKPVRLVKVS